MCESPSYQCEDCREQYNWYVRFLRKNGLGWTICTQFYRFSAKSSFSEKKCCTVQSTLKFFMRPTEYGLHLTFKNQFSHVGGLKSRSFCFSKTVFACISSSSIRLFDCKICWTGKMLNIFNRFSNLIRAPSFPSSPVFSSASFTNHVFVLTNRWSIKWKLLQSKG